LIYFFLFPYYFVNKVEQNNREIKKNKSIENFIKHFRNFSREKKRFEHRAVITSLYGTLENHINLWVQEHISNIPFILKDKSLLSSKILDSNFKVADDFIEFQNSLLIKRILSCNNKEEVLKNINDFVSTDIESLKGKFSNKMLMNFRWQVTVLKEFLIKSEIREFIKKLKTVLLFNNIKYIYTARTVIFMKVKKKKFIKIFDSRDYSWEVKKV